MVVNAAYKDRKLPVVVAVCFGERAVNWRLVKYVLVIHYLSKSAAILGDSSYHI